VTLARFNVCLENHVPLQVTVSAETASWASRAQTLLQGAADLGRKQYETEGRARLLAETSIPHTKLYAEVFDMVFKGIDVQCQEAQVTLRVSARGGLTKLVDLSVLELARTHLAVQNTFSKVSDRLKSDSSPRRETADETP
jgi:hypothetical protein